MLVKREKSEKGSQAGKIATQKTGGGTDKLRRPREMVPPWREFHRAGKGQTETKNKAITKTRKGRGL